MFKFISVLLLIVVCFLVGTLVGINHNGTSIFSTETATKSEKIDTIPNVKQTVQQTTQETEVVNEQTVAQELSNSNTEHLSQKTASFLEVIVQGFYDIIVEILYQLSQLFY